MHNLESLLEERSDIRLMKCLVKHVTVVAPVRTEDQYYAPMIFLDRKSVCRERVLMPV